MWKIKKAFDFDYGHRVHVQVLRPELSMTEHCACRHLHGHRGRIWIELEAPALNDQQMVLDFKELGWFKNLVEDLLDHKFLIDQGDPLLDLLTAGRFHEFRPFEFQGKTIAHVWDGHQGRSQSAVELLSGLIVVPFVPTSEQLSKFVHDLVTLKMAPYGVRCSSVTWEETPKSCSTYQG